MDITLLDISNQCLVGARGDTITIMRPMRVMSRPEALVLAAWLVALADREDDFRAVLAKVQNT